MISMFGITNCSTVKKARDFLDKHKINYAFIDFKKNPPTKLQLMKWGDFVNELPINKIGTTYRMHKEHYELLPESEKIEFIIAHSSLIKRPILENDGKVIAIGFKNEEYQDYLVNL